MPSEQILVRHDDGRWYVARLLGQRRTPDGWRVGVRYTVEVGMTYQRVLWAEECRPVVDQRYQAPQRAQREPSSGRSS